MKVNIHKYQNGGGFIQSHFAVNTPTQNVPTATSMATKQQSAQGSSDFGKDEILKDLISKGGLENDVYAFTAELAKVDLSPSSILIPSNTNNIIKVIGKYNEVARNRQAYDKAEERAVSNGSYDELAVSSAGHVFYKDDIGNIKKTTTNDYRKSPQKYGNLLSVADLMWERNKNSNLAYDKEIFNVAQNSIGLEKITDHIQKLFNTLSDYSQITERHYAKPDLQNQLDTELQNLAGRKPSEEEKKSISFLRQLISTPGEFVKENITQERKGKDINAALNYIWSTLGSSEKRKLEAVASLNNQSSGEIIVNMLNNFSGGKSDIKISPEKETDITSAPKVLPQKEVTVFELQHNGKLIGEKSVNWNDIKTGLNMNLTGNNVNIWDNINSNSRITLGPLKQLLESHTGALLEQGKIFFGNQKVGLSDYTNIIVDPAAGSARVFFPTTNGEPDYEVMRKISELRKEAPKNLTPQELTEFYHKKGYDFVEFDNNFQMKENGSVKPYLLVYGYADENAKSVINNPEIRELSGKEETEAKDTLPTIFEKFKVESPTGFFNWSNTYYKGSILIPYQKNASIIAAALAGNITSPKTTLEEAKVHSEVDNARIINGNSSIFNTK